MCLAFGCQHICRLIPQTPFLKNERDGSRLHWNDFDGFCWLRPSCVAPTVYEKFDKIFGCSKWKDYICTHPSGRMRAESLSQAKAMEEAFAIYREVKSGQEVKGFSIIRFFKKFFKFNHST